MRIAVIGDIHGNLGALEAVLADIENRGADVTVNLGDVVSGPLQPRQTAERLIGMPIPTIRGNHERQLLTVPEGDMGESDRHAMQRLSPDQYAWLEGFPSTLVVGDDVFLCHGTPASDVDYFLETVDERGCRPAGIDEVEERAAGCVASLIVCGHTHLPRVARLSDGRVVMNPGSVGLQAYPAKWPYVHTMEAGSPHARYAIAERTSGDWQVDLIEVAYDWNEAARMAELNGRADWAAGLRTGRISS
ncbi:MAG TPA: metallophosphoesterase family protein [Terracidiphilus sp.]|nr:metallophosphoesterase family protein [Terracidiphilus sp.]